jgi:hypothetical protein
MVQSPTKDFIIKKINILEQEKQNGGENQEGFFFGFHTAI